MSANKNFCGNILGDARAENDYNMLKSAFVETSDYHALINTTDFNFIVGRRGTGKSALYLMASRYFRNEKIIEYIDCHQKNTTTYRSNPLYQKLQTTINKHDI